MPKPNGSADRNVVYNQVFTAQSTQLQLARNSDGRHSWTAAQAAHRASFLQRRAPIIHFALTSYPGHHPSIPASPLIRSLLQSTRVHDAIQSQLQCSGEKESAVCRRARTIAQQMSADVRLWAVKWLGYALGHLWRLLFRDQVYVDQEGLARVSRLTSGVPLVYLPTHRSHIDYLLLSYVLFSRDVTVPHIAAGDNLQIPLLGWVMRKGGAFFMRRSIRGSPDENVYKALLAEYIQILLQRGQSLEFFIEGGRCRDGKVCPPKLGLLSLVFDSVLDGHVPDVYLVPLAIDYDVVLDEQSYVRESLGLQKPRETLLQAVRAFWSALWRDNGRVFVTFAEPISLRDWLEAKQGKGVGARRSSSLVGGDTRHRLQDKLAAFHAASAEAAASPVLPRPPALLPENSVKDRAAVFQNGGPAHGEEKSPSPAPPTKGESLGRRPSAVGALAAQFNAVGGQKPLLPSPQQVKAATSRRPPLSPSGKAKGRSESVERETVERPVQAEGVEFATAAVGQAERDDSRNSLVEADVDKESRKGGSSETRESDSTGQPSSPQLNTVALSAERASALPPPPRELSIDVSGAEEVSSPIASGQPTIDRVFVGRDQRRELVGALGEDLGAAIRRSVAATPTALVAAALLTAPDGAGLGREECAAAVDYIAWQVLARGGQIAVAGGAPWSRAAAGEAVEDGVRLLGASVGVEGMRLRPGRDPEHRLTLQYHCNQLVHLFAGEALVACAFASALSESAASDTARRRATILRSTVAEKARWLRRLMRPEFDPLLGTVETDALWEEALAGWLERLGQAEAVLSLEGGRHLRPASLDPDGKSLEARGVLAFAAALVRPHIRTYAYALRCLLALQSRPPLPDSAVVAALQAACADPLPFEHQNPSAPADDILPSVFVLRGLLMTVHSLGLLPRGAAAGQPNPRGRLAEFARSESVADFGPAAERSPRQEAVGGLGAGVEDAPAGQQLERMAIILDGFAAPLRI